MICLCTFKPHSSSPALHRFRVRSTRSSPSLYMFAPKQALVRLKSKHSYGSYNILKLIPNDSNLNQAIGHQHRAYY